MEVIYGDSKPKKLTADWPRQIYGNSCSMVNHFGSILMSQGNNFKTFQKLDMLDTGSWNKHKTLNMKRSFETAVTTETATFVFGGSKSPNTYEYLPYDAEDCTNINWVLGKSNIPDGFDGGCAIHIKSKNEIWLIGGYSTEQRILSFDVNDHTFKEMPIQLNIGRYGHRCEFIPNTNKILITGGCDVTDTITSTTEILDIDNESVTMASPLNSGRVNHGIGVLTINDENRIAVFGGGVIGSGLRSVELYDAKSQEWEITKIKLSEGRHSFGFLSVTLGDLKDDCTSSELYTQLCQKHKNVYLKSLNDMGAYVPEQ